MGRALNNWLSGKFGPSVEEVARRKASAAAHRTASERFNTAAELERARASREAKAGEMLQDEAETVEPVRESNPEFGSW